MNSLATDTHSDSESTCINAADMSHSEDDILEIEAEQEKLVTKSKLEEALRSPYPDNGADNDIRAQNRVARRTRKAARRKSQPKNDQDAALMFEMEGGFKDSSSEDNLIARKHLTQPKGGRAVCRLTLYSGF